ncbi:MAG: GIY-YIG nuclease family protein [Chloroflexota bacterium]
MPQFQFDAWRYPVTPGCYLLKDAAGTIIYAGKAKNLRRRLASHFLSDRRSHRLVAEIADIEVILVTNETEALILEINLIKRHQPRYNRMLKDEDDGYFYIALTAEDLPRLVPYRKGRVNKALERGGPTSVARVFGPYISRRFRDALLEFVTGHFQLRTCAPLPHHVCLRYHLGTCSGICEQKVSVPEYARAVGEAVGILSRGHVALIRHMKRQMLNAAAQLDFERAQRLKTHVEALEGALEPQVVERDVGYDQDALCFGEQSVRILHVERGVVQGLSLHDLESTGGAGEYCDRFLIAHYARRSPAELIVNLVGDAAGVEQTLTRATGHRVRVVVPQRGARHALLKLCELNHEYRVAEARPGGRVADAPATVMQLPSATPVQG